MQNLGGILTGSATDVGTGPVLILLALAFWPLGRTGTRRASQQHLAEAPPLPAPPARGAALAARSLGARYNLSSLGDRADEG
jgi:hypothetical protein